jgi:hypothetical protein
MKICDLVSGIGRMKRSASLLKDHWQEARAHWHDQASADFEKAFLQPIPPQLTLAVASIYKLAEILQQAESELEDERTASLS